MREILFRMYDGVKMVYDGLVIHNGELYEDWRAFEDGVKSDNPLMQYTGLDDKNGVKIFEGDIIKSGDVTAVVIYLTGSFKIRRFNGIVNHLVIARQAKFKVIGNIYDNPELMEVTE